MAVNNYSRALDYFLTSQGWSCNAKRKLAFAKVQLHTLERMTKTCSGEAERRRRVPWHAAE